MLFGFIFGYLALFLLSPYRRKKVWTLSEEIFIMFSIIFYFFSHLDSSLAPEAGGG
jgi:hypothetical protein